MTARRECERTRNAAAELALGVLSGDERADALEHIACCPECRELVLGLSSLGDGLLTLTPTKQPPVGFESNVMAALKTRRRRSYRRWAAAVATVALAAGLTAGGVLVATRDDRDLAARYRSALAQANGKYFAVWELQTSAGSRSGNVFGYEGHPSWVFVTFEDASPGTYVASMSTSSRDIVDLGTFELSSEKGTWGTELPIDLEAVEVLTITRAGKTAYTSSFGSGEDED